MIQYKNPYNWCPNPCEFDPKLSRCLLASHPRTNSTLGGAPTCATTARANLGAGAPSDATPTAIEDRPSRLLITGLLSIIFTAASE
jgi:hypothetical protein